MIEVTEHLLSDLVTDALKKREAAASLRVVERAIRHEEDWWYVPVTPVGAMPRSDEYYDALADVEEELRESHQLNVTLVPTYNIIKLVPRRAVIRTMHVQLGDWEKICDAAKLPVKAEYSADESASIAAAICTNPNVINFDPPQWRDEVVDFFKHSGGLQTR